MGKFSGCLLACDIDGTTVVDGVLPKRNIEAIERFKSEGGMVSLATGRTISALSPVIELYNGYAPSIICNGCMIYDTVKGKVLYERALQKADLALIDRAVAVAPAVGIEVHCGGTVYTLRRTEETDDHQEYEKMLSVQISEISETGGKSINKLLYLFNDEKEQETVKRALTNYENCTFFDVLVMIYGKWRRYLEQMPAGVSKGKTLLVLADMFGIKRENVFAIGDNYNDIEMMSTAAFSACPSESPDEVKAAAAVTVGSAKDGAVADFIEYLERR